MEEHYHLHDNGCVVAFQEGLPAELLARAPNQTAGQTAGQSLLPVSLTQLLSLPDHKPFANKYSPLFAVIHHHYIIISLNREDPTRQAKHHMFLHSLLSFHLLFLFKRITETKETNTNKMVYQIKFIRIE